MKVIEDKVGEISNPPGGILVWLLIILEIFTFLGASLVFLYYRADNLSSFIESQEHLDPILGTVNTIILITSGYLMAISLLFLRQNNNAKSSKYMFVGVLLGVLFLAVKGYEFYAKIELGIGFSYNTFFTFYWMMTGFHFIHVLFGVGLLAVINKSIKNNKYNSESLFDVESSISYWHMCDLIWILIFPILYLL